MKTYFILGGAGFIGSNLVKTILEKEKEARVIVYDNFSSGKMWHLDSVKNNKKLKIIRGDATEIKVLKHAMKGADIVYHLASNPDIAKAATHPDIDFWEGTYITNNVLEAMRVNGVKKILYTSGSGVYGDTGLKETGEEYSPMLPISTYGASKLACEAMICSYCYMFKMQAVIFRFANVVGPHQTHGVGYDFVKKLMQDPDQLFILGDGKQSKSYIYITDIIAAMHLLEKRAPRGFSYYNVATLDYLSVNEIADIATRILGLKKVKYRYSGGSRGWKGDVPIVRMDSKKIRKLGWRNKYTAKEAISKAIKELYLEAKINHKIKKGLTK